MGQIGDMEATEVLVSTLEDRMFDVRWLAAEALISIGREALAPLLRTLVKRPDSYWLRTGAHHVLHDIEKWHLDELLWPILVALEDTYEIEIQDEDLQNVTNMGEFIAYVERKVAEKSKS